MPGVLPLCIGAPHLFGDRLREREKVLDLLAILLLLDAQLLVRRLQVHEFALDAEERRVRLLQRLLQL